ncbi:endo-1,4-beta-xylanase [Natrinema salaciae]|uniref:endo-1,4-beta-xylanase n=1 Tax=Natrinema salaciae TaxID=1186196 RepID=A0A1H9IH47_9EURY|nr:endo-1,4-beta-xylanase [Natrinema salaciae]SEQ73792.1 Endo-1,4-beta-xylanase, GH35 family [Natrinema salaciae]
MTDTDGTRHDRHESNRSEASGGPDEDRRDRRPTDDRAAPLERREYLRSVGAIGTASAVGVLGATTGTAAVQADDWELAADERIEQHRTSDLEIVVQNADGTPIPDATVDVEMREHAYGFGTQVNAELLVEGSIEGDPVDEADLEAYRERVPELFNTAVLGNHHKWRFWEENRETADAATEWLLDRELDVRGHTCVWGNRDTYAVPADVETAIDERDAETIRERSLEHIETIIRHYGDDIEEWDVVNEALHAHDLMVGVYDDAVDEDRPWEGDVVPWRSELLADWYERAQTVADEAGVDIAVNDFNTLSGPEEYARDWYTEQIEFLRGEGIELDGIGFQCHFAVDQRLTPDEIVAGLDLYADYGATLTASEFDMFQGDWESQDQQAAFFRQFLKTFFSHPATSDFLVWGFWDGDHWAPDYDGSEPDAPLFEEDWTPKPAYDVYTDLVFDEWWTEESGTTDADGTFETTAFLGRHDLTVTVGGESTTRTVAVTEPDGVHDVVVTVDDSRSDEPVQVGDYEARDTTGDGLYNDVDGDGQTTHADVNAFYEHLEADGVQDNPDAFDFDGNDRIGFADVLDLLRRI